MRFRCDVDTTPRMVNGADSETAANRIIVYADWIVLFAKLYFFSQIRVIENYLLD